MRERPAKTRTPVEPQAVVRAALEILDAKGLEHVTLREIASKIGVKAPALYWHFRDKRDIVDDMAQAILKDAHIDQIQAPSDAANSWADWLAEVAHLMRKALLSHREGGRVVAGASFGRARSLATLAINATKVMNEAGFDIAHASLAVATVFNYVWGDVIEEQAGYGPEPKGGAYSEEWTEEVRKIIAQSDFGSQMKALDSIVKEIDGLPIDERFDWGLHVIIVGLKLRLKEMKSGKG